jgi:dienelactone hydrolase
MLALPGWDDDGEGQFRSLSARLQPDGWVCRRANIPDASWPAAERAQVSRHDSMGQVLEDYMNLAAVRGVSRSRIALVGFSYGGYMATFLAHAKPVRWLVLRSPALYPDSDWSTPKEELDTQQLAEYRAHVLSPSQNRSLWCCAQFTGDVLLIDSEHDQVIPPPVIESYARSFERARSLTRFTVAQADHELSNPAWQKAYHDALLDWLAQQVEGSQ